MPKTVIFSHKAPRAIGPYSQAIRKGDLLFISGQIPIDPETGSIIDGGIEEQTKQVLKNIDEILQESEFSKDDVLKTTIFLQSLADFHIVNSLYGEYFSAPFPARSCVEVSALPKGSLIEIELIATK